MQLFLIFLLSLSLSLALLLSCCLAVVFEIDFFHASCKINCKRNATKTNYTKTPASERKTKKKKDDADDRDLLPRDGQKLGQRSCLRVPSSVAQHGGGAGKTA